MSFKQQGKRACQNQVRKCTTWHLQRTSQCVVDWSIHKVSMKHSSKVIMIRRVWYQEFKKPSYKTLASVYSISNKQQYEWAWIQSEKSNMATHIQLSQILNKLILSLASDMVNINKKTIVDIQVHLQHAHEMIEFLQLESQLQRDE